MDKQAAARCWRDGNARPCYTYRLLTAGTIEEKIYQRQLAKEGLAAVVEDRAQSNAFDASELRDLFGDVAALDAASDTHRSLGCACAAECTIIAAAKPTVTRAADPVIRFMPEAPRRRPRESPREISRATRPSLFLRMILDPQKS